MAAQHATQKAARPSDDSDLQSATPICFGNRSSCVAARVILIIIAAAMSLGTAGCAGPYADDVSSKDLRVMRAMVDIACKLDAERIIVSDRPAIPRASDDHDTDHKNVQFGINFDLRLADRARWPRGQVCAAVRVVSDSAIVAALASKTEFPGSWDNFKAKFGGAHSLMRISLPVYSSDGRHAVIYTTGRCPYTCGAGFYHQLEKTYEGWKITNSAKAWSL